MFFYHFPADTVPPPPLYLIYPFIQIQIRYYIYFISLSASCKVSNARFTPKSYVMIKYELKNVCRGVQGGPGCTGLLRVGGTHDGVGAHLILHLLAFPFLRQSTFYIVFDMWIALTQTKRLSKKNYILIHNNTLQSFVWSSIALNIHVSHFENWLFFCGFSVTYKFLASETMEKWFQRYILLMEGHFKLRMYFIYV